MTGPTATTATTDGRSDLIMVPARRLIESPVDAVFALAPGDRPLVDVGESVVVGAPIAERLLPKVASLDKRNGGGKKKK